MFESRAPGQAAAGGPRLLGDVGGTNARFGWQDDAAAPITRDTCSGGGQGDKFLGVGRGGGAVRSGQPVFHLRVGGLVGDTAGAHNHETWGVIGVIEDIGLERQARRARVGRNVTQMHLARKGIITQIGRAHV